MDVEEEILELKRKCAKAQCSADALRFSQAALNLAHVQEVLLINAKS